MIGANWGVEWCVVGVDRNWAYNPACKAAALTPPAQADVDRRLIPFHCHFVLDLFSCRREKFPSSVLVE